ncbi:MAG: hypothetical protein EOM20_00935 [Spartobacteria bacterium]|nr:hypothetical protein [Spartobacteria bacterium]
MPSEGMRTPGRYTTLLLWLGVGGLVLLALLLRWHVYAVSAAHIPVTSDEAITVLQAKRILRGHLPLLMMSQPYMFPLEAYWMAPLVSWTPRTPAGMRVLMLLEGGLSCAGLLLILLRVGKWKDIWPGVLLALFPSAYYLMTHYGYSMPHHISAHILWWLAVLLTYAIPRKGNAHARQMLVLAAAFTCGLALTNSLLSLAFVLPLIPALGLRLWGPRWRTGLVLAVAGFLLGLLPHLLARWVFPGAHQAVAGTRSLSDALGLLWQPTLAFTLPRALGMAPCLFPDSRETLSLGAGMTGWFTVLYLLLLLLATLRAVWALAGQARHKRPLDIPVGAVFVAASWLGIFFFIMSTRADAYSYRYLAPTALAFPVVLCYAYQLLPRGGRFVVAALAVLLAGYHVLSTRQVLAHWQDGDFAREVVSTPDLQPAIDYLRAQGITHAVASHWAAYRIGFITDEEIICSQPLNERFPGWPLPYKDEVDRSTHVAYVLTDHIRFLKPDIFERHMRTMQVGARRVRAGDFLVYHDFIELLPHGPERPVPPETITMRADDGQASLPALLDNDRTTKWFSEEPQYVGMYLEATLDRARWLNRLTMFYGSFAHDIVPEARVEVRTEEGWKSVQDRWPGVLDKFVFEQDHPVYGVDAQTLRFVPVKGDAVRITIQKPADRFCWTVTGLVLYETDEPDKGQE